MQKQTVNNIESRLAAIERAQKQIIHLLNKEAPPCVKSMNLKEAAAYVGYSPHYFRRLAVEQQIIPFSRPSKQQKGKLFFKKEDLDEFLEQSSKNKKIPKQAGRKRLPTNTLF